MKSANVVRDAESGANAQLRMRGSVLGNAGSRKSSGGQEAVMNRISKDENMLQKWVVLLLLMAVPAFAWGQKKTSAPAPKAAPAQHAAAPSHAAPSRPATQAHGSAPSR